MIKGDRENTMTANGKALVKLNSGLRNMESDSGADVDKLGFSCQSLPELLHILVHVL
jgi:hypothetical protein